MFPYDAVLFDLDGTLTESAPGIMRSAGYAARKMGYADFDPEVLRRFIGPPLFESFQQIFGMDDEQAAQAVEYYQMCIRDRCCTCARAARAWEEAIPTARPTTCIRLSPPIFGTGRNKKTP